MSKVRVHELAKEIDKTSKEIMDYLKGNGADLKSHMSFLTEQQVEDVKKKFGSAGHNAEAPKKKTIVQVFRPQNTQGGQRRQNARGAQRPGGQQASGRTGMDKEKREGYVSAQERGRDNNRPARDGNKDRQGRDFRDRDRQGQGRDGNKDRQGGKDFRDEETATETARAEIPATEEIVTETVRAEDQETEETTDRLSRHRW